MRHGPESFTHLRAAAPRQVRNCESALMALMRHVGGQDKPRLLGAEDPATSKPVSACSSNTSLPGEAGQGWFFTVSSSPRQLQNKQTT